MGHVFGREELEDGIPLAEDERLPEPAHASVAVGEGVDELELVVEDAAFDEQVVGGFLEPSEQVVDQRGDVGGGGGHVNDALAVRDADAGAAEMSGGVIQRGHHDLMRLQQVLD